MRSKLTSNIIPGVNFGSFPFQVGSTILIHPALSTQLAGCRLQEHQRGNEAECWGLRGVFV